MPEQTWFLQKHHWQVYIINSWFHKTGFCPNGSQIFTWNLDTVSNQTAIDLTYQTGKQALQTVGYQNLYYDCFWYIQVPLRCILIGTYFNMTFLITLYWVTRFIHSKFIVMITFFFCFKRKISLYKWFILLTP